MRLEIPICLLLSSCAAFVFPMSSRRCDSACFVVQKDDDVPKRKQRFAQDAHIARPRRIESVNKPLSPSTSSSSSEADKARTVGKPLRRSSPPVPTKLDDELMWRTNKSIDDIEASMVKRWGTELRKWAADPNEYELEDAASDDSFRPEQNFRGKPVLDPWQKEELKSKPKDKSDTANNGVGVFATSLDEEMVLQKARRNQRQPKTDTRTRKPSWANLVEEEEPREEVNDFYDEDDEGFELDGTVRSDRDDYDIGKLISPKPVGGLGSKKVISDSPGFFFNSNVATVNDAEPASSEESVEEELQKQPSKIRSALPLLNEDGKPFYLTVAQAESNFRIALAGNAASQEKSSVSSAEQASWNEFGITSKRLLQNLQSMGCGTPLSVQCKSCPSILTGKDVLVGTYTGSGKTLAFLVPLVQRLLFDASSPGDGVQVMIVAPGRELASQIATVTRSLLEGTGLSIVLAIGGTTFSRNLEQLRKKKPTIVVGTPGRIAELVVGQPGEK